MGTSEPTGMGSFFGTQQQPQQPEPPPPQPKPPPPEPPLGTGPQPREQFSPQEPNPPQSDKPLSRFRLRPRPYTQEEFALLDDIKLAAQELEKLYGRLPPSRYHSLALTALEESVLWASEGLTR